MEFKNATDFKELNVTTLPLSMTSNTICAPMSPSIGYTADENDDNTKSQTNKKFHNLNDFKANDFNCKTSEQPSFLKLANNNQKEKNDQSLCSSLLYNMSTQLSNSMTDVNKHSTFNIKRRRISETLDFRNRGLSMHDNSFKLFDSAFHDEKRLKVSSYRRSSSSSSLSSSSISPPPHYSLSNFYQYKLDYLPIFKHCNLEKSNKDTFRPKICSFDQQIISSKSTNLISFNDKEFQASALEAKDETKNKDLKNAKVIYFLPETNGNLINDNDNNKKFQATKFSKIFKNETEELMNNKQEQVLSNKMQLTTLHQALNYCNTNNIIPRKKCKKKPYKELTLEEKVELIRLAECNSTLSQACIAERYKIAKSNVCRILQRRNEYLRAYESAGFAGSRKRKLRGDNYNTTTSTSSITTIKNNISIPFNTPIASTSKNLQFNGENKSFKNFDHIKTHSVIASTTDSILTGSYKF